MNEEKKPAEFPGVVYLDQTDLEQSPSLLGYHWCTHSRNKAFNIPYVPESLLAKEKARAESLLEALNYVKERTEQDSNKGMLHTDLYDQLECAELSWKPSQIIRPDNDTTKV